MEQGNYGENFDRGYEEQARPRELRSHILASRLRNSLCYYIMNHIKKSTLIFVFLHFF
jgi:hypothetical protein